MKTIFHHKVTCVYVCAGGGVSTDLHLVPFTSRYLIHEPIFLTHFLTCTFISMSTSISKGCHGHVCWGKTRYHGLRKWVNRFTGYILQLRCTSSLSPIQYSNPVHFASKLQCPRVRTYMVQPFRICLVYFVMKKVKHGRSIVMGHTSYNCYSVYPILKLLDPIFLITKLNQITFHEDNFS